MFYKLFVILIFTVISFFPGLVFARCFKKSEKIYSIAAGVMISLSFWICFVWFSDFLGTGISVLFFTAVAIAIGFEIYFSRKSGLLFYSGLFSGLIKKEKIAYVFLLFVLLGYGLPYFGLFLPPGADTSMHGYITRLILNNNQLPLTYDPVVPGFEFGSYSSGYHILTALVSCFNLSLLRESINLMTVATYLTLILSIIFLFRQFFSGNVAVCSGILTVTLSRNLQTTIGWGGNPSVLAFSFCLISVGMIIYSINNSDKKTFLLSCLPLAAVPLTHAIPAVTIFYLAFPGVLLLLYFNKNQFRWMTTNLLWLSLLTLVLLIPFLIRFGFENSPELTEMIKNWQIKMMGDSVSDQFFENCLNTITEIKMQLSDPLVITTILALIGSIILKSFKQLSIIFLFIISTFFLILNYIYWKLPLSEILYPERISYFMTVLFGLIIGLFGQRMSDRNIFPKYVFFIVPVLLAVSVPRFLNGYFFRAIHVYSDYKPENIEDSFNWLAKNTEKNSIMKCTYSDVGMWLPAFTNKPTVGAHFHFIHTIKHVAEKLDQSDRPKYYFVTSRDFAGNTEIISETVNKTIVFQNENITIFK